MLQEEEEEADEDRPSHAPHRVILCQACGQEPKSDQIGPDKAQSDQHENGRHAATFVLGYRTRGMEAIKVPWDLV